MRALPKNIHSPARIGRRLMAITAFGAGRKRCESARESGSWEQSVPDVRDPNRLPDPSTVRRWCWQLFLLAIVLSNKLWQAVGWNTSRPPTILAWDWNAISRILPLEARQFVNRKLSMS